MKPLSRNRGHGAFAATSARGFSLIELMVAVAVVAILAVVAIPSYSAYVIRSKRAEAKTALLQGAQYLERNFSQAGCYSFTDAPSCTQGAPVGTGLAVTPPIASAAPDYAVAPATLVAQAYVLQATPCGAAACAGGSTFTDPDCGALTLDNTGAKGALAVSPLTTATATGATLAAIQQCWQR
jgi:type IV pilus assembly protein PilE